MSNLQYQTGNPTKTGVYACRVDNGLRWGEVVLLKDEFLFWNQEYKRWGYLGIDQWFRSEVLGWIGPLPRKSEDQKCK